MKQPLEKEIEKKVCIYAEEQGCYVRKFSSPQRRGVPDRLFITPHGRVFFIEFKRTPKDVPSPLQEREIGTIRRRGVSVFVIGDVQHGKDRVREQIDLGHAV